MVDDPRVADLMGFSKRTICDLFSVTIIWRTRTFSPRALGEPTAITVVQTQINTRVDTQAGLFQRGACDIFANPTKKLNWQSYLHGCKRISSPDAAMFQCAWIYCNLILLHFCQSHQKTKLTKLSLWLQANQRAWGRHVSMRLDLLQFNTAPRRCAPVDSSW